MNEDQTGHHSLGTHLPASYLSDSIDEPRQDSAAPAQRLAGVGAAFGSCFSVMIAVLVVGSAGSISGPRAGFAANSRETTTAPNQQPPEPTSGRSAPTDPADQAVGSVVPIEDRLRLQSLERTAMLARAEAQAAESRLAMLRSDLEHRALERAERERAKADQVESNGSPYDWITTQQLATRTRDRARTQLDTDLGTLQTLQASAEVELARLRDAADGADGALAMARAGLLAKVPRAAPAAVGSTAARVAAGEQIRPAATLQGDLRSLIARHHASLVEAISTTAAGD